MLGWNGGGPRWISQEEDQGVSIRVSERRNRGGRVKGVDQWHVGCPAYVEVELR